MGGALFGRQLGLGGLGRPVHEREEVLLLGLGLFQRCLALFQRGSARLQIRLRLRNARLAGGVERCQPRDGLVCRGNALFMGRIGFAGFFRDGLILCNFCFLGHHAFSLPRFLPSIIHRWSENTSLSAKNTAFFSTVRIEIREKT